MNVRGDDLTGGDRYARAEVTVGTATSDGALIALGHNPKHSPASDNDLSTVDEIRNA